MREAESSGAFPYRCRDWDRSRSFRRAGRLQLGGRLPLTAERVAAGVREVCTRSRASAHERGRRESGCRGRCGVLRDQIGRRNQCEGQAGTRMETATPGVAASIGLHKDAADRHPRNVFKSLPRDHRAYFSLACFPATRPDSQRRQVALSCARTASPAPLLPLPCRLYSPQARLR
jgi:hypothetical protein